MKLARGSIWAKGLNDYIRYLETWKANGDLKGIEVQCV